MMNTFIYVMCASVVLILSLKVVHAQDWISAKQTLVVDIEQTVAADTLRFIINNSDLTDFFKPIKEGQFAYQAQFFPLPSGISVLNVYEVVDGQWHEIHSQEVQVLTASGFEVANWSASGSVSVDAQLDAEFQGDAFAPEETRFRTVNGQLQLTSEHVRKGLSIQAGLNLVGSSKQENALRFSEKGEQAAKVDLSDYLVTVQKGKVSVSVGHQSHGANPLLVDNLANRGVHLGYQINDQFDFAFTQQNGSGIVGWNNILGLQNSQHSIIASTLGAEMFPNEPGKLRIEVSYLDGKVQSINDFAVGQVSDVEKNQGWGIRVMSQLWENSLRIEGSLATSRFINPDDGALAAVDNEFDLVQVEQTTDHAYQFNIEWDILPQNEQGDRFFTASLTLGQDKVDAFYRVIAAAPSADQKNNRIGLSGAAGTGSWQYDFSESENNQDRIPSILTTNTKSHRFNYSVDLASVFLDDDSDTQPNRYLPSINLNVQNVHQLAINNPDADISGFNGGSHLPDQATRMYELAANWSFDTYSLGYNLSFSNQDNRQVGRDTADFTQLNHNINQSFQLFELLNLSVDLGRARNFEHENSQAFYTNNGALSVNYVASESWQFNLGASVNKDYDNFGLATSRAFTLNLGAENQWTLTLYSQEFSGQWYIRYAKQRNESQDNVFVFNSFAQDWNVTSGFSMTF